MGSTSNNSSPGIPSGVRTAKPEEQMFLRLFRLNQSRQAAVVAHGGGDDVAGLDNPRRAAGRFLAGDDVAGGRAVRREVANLDVVKRLAGLRREQVSRQVQFASVKANTRAAIRKKPRLPNST